MKLCFKKVVVVLLVIFLFTMSFCTVGFGAGSSGSLVAHYTFDGDFKDSSGSGIDGTAVGDVTFADDGVAGKCAIFNHGYLNVANGSSFNLGKQFTISAWIKLDPSAKDQDSNPIIFKSLPDSNDMELTSASAYGTDSLELFQRSVMPDNSTSLSNVKCQELSLDEGWTHVAFSTDGNTQFIYVNGKLLATEDMPDDIKGGDFTSTGKFLIGKGGNNDTFLGKMDDLRIYNYALSNDEVKVLANSGAQSHKIVLQLLNSKMTVDGKEMPIDPSNPSVIPYSENGRTLVPIRAIVESMGGTVNWIGSKREVDITLKSIIVKLWLNNQNAEVNGKKLTLDVPGKSVEGRTMVPVRFVTENLGAKVDWNGSTQKITISY